LKIKLFKSNTIFLFKKNINKKHEKLMKCERERPERENNTVSPYRKL